VASLAVTVAAEGAAGAQRVLALFAVAAVVFLFWAARAPTRSARFASLSLLFGALGFCSPENALGWDPATHPGAKVFLAARVALAAAGLLFCVLALARRRQDSGGLLLPLVGGLAATLHLAGVVVYFYLFGNPGAGV